jgi:hypothetical protein
MMGQAMDAASVTDVLEFEVFVLLTMKLRLKMSQKLDHLEAKLTDHGLTVADGERIHDRVAQALGDEISFFDNLTHLLGADRGSTSLKFTSVLWPEFDFTAVAGEGRQTASALYRHVRADGQRVDSPTELPLWGLDLDEFAAQFGPLKLGSQWPLFDEHIPAYAEHEFEWNGWPYGAGFSWGLFMFAAQSWE